MLNFIINGLFYLSIQRLRQLDEKRIEYFRRLILKCVDIEKTRLPIIEKCLDEMSQLLQFDWSIWLNVTLHLKQIIEYNCVSYPNSSKRCLACLFFTQ